MSGVEIELSVEGGEHNAQDDGATEAEAGDSRTQASTATGGRPRSQGQ